MYSHLRRLRRPHLTLTVGKPFKMDATGEDPQALRLATQQIMELIGQLLPATTCSSLGASEPTCLGGFAFDDATKTCMSAEADGNYPGCPAGQILDPSTGMCDPHTSFASATGLHHVQVLQVSLPDCEDGPEKEGKCVPDGYTKCP